MPTSTFTAAVQFAVGNASFTATNELTGNKCLTKLSVKDVEINSSSENSSNPVASQSTTDSGSYSSLLAIDLNIMKIMQPSKMRITGFTSDMSGANQIMSLFENTQATIKIVSKGIVARGMAIVDVEIEQTPDIMSAVKWTINLEQANPTPSQAGWFNPAQTQDASTYGTSIQSPTSLTSGVSTLYNKISNTLGAL